MLLPIIDAKVKFFNTFIVEVDSLAAQEVHYNKNTKSLEYGDGDVYGETVLVRIRNKDRDTLLELERSDEDQLIDELSALFSAHNYNERTFVAEIDTKYSTFNLA